MALFLVQHGKARPEEEDPERRLSDEGRKEVEKVAALAAELGLQVSRIEHSGKARARETAEILAAALKPPGGVKEREGLNPLDEVEPVAGKLRSEDELMLVGHLPFMEKLASYLVLAAVEPPIIKFINGGIVCLDREPESARWHIKWALPPRLG